jgi:hypothetical protein
MTPYHNMLWMKSVNGGLHWGDRWTGFSESGGKRKGKSGDNFETLPKRNIAATCWSHAATTTLAVMAGLVPRLSGTSFA